MWNVNKPLIILLLLTTLLLSISSVNAIDELTLDGDSVVDKDMDIPTDSLDINFNDNDKTFTFKINDKRSTSYKPSGKCVQYYHKVDNKDVKDGSGIILLNNEKTLNYGNDGVHNLIIKDSEARNPVIFNATFNIQNNIAQTQNINIQHTKKIHITIENGKIMTGVLKDEMGDGEHLLSEYLLTGTGDTNVPVLKVNYRGYMINGVDTRPYTVLGVDGYTYYGIIVINGYKYVNTYRYNHDNLRISSQDSWDGQYGYQYKQTIYTPVKVKKPVYAYKKVKKYKWKYYKTKWVTKKVVTHRIQNGKLTTYHTAYDKIRELKNKNAKVIKTVYSKSKTTVYLKQPIDYYKKVKTYKKKRYIKKYKTVTQKKAKNIWVDARGTIDDIISHT